MGVVVVVVQEVELTLSQELLSIAVLVRKSCLEDLTTNIQRTGRKGSELWKT